MDGRSLFYYLLFLLVDGSVSIMAYIVEKEPLLGVAVDYPSAVLLSLGDVLCHLQKLYEAIKGELQSWGVLKRTGNVTIANK